jgi:hypothetical protein
MTAEQYWLKFDAFVIKAGLNPDKDYKFLHRIISTRMQRSLIKQCYGLSPVPSTIEGWHKHTIAFDRSWREYNDIVAQFDKNKKPTYTRTPTTTAPQTAPPKAVSNIENVLMDVDTRRANAPRREWVASPKQKEMMQQGKCFNCEEIGHRSRDCTKPKRQAFRSMETVPETPQNDDKDALIASLMDRLDIMEKRLKNRDF